MPPAVFEPTIPASQLPQTHALDRAATGIGCKDQITVILRVMFLGVQHNVSPYGKNTDWWNLRTGCLPEHFAVRWKKQKGTPYSYISKNLVSILQTTNYMITITVY